MIRDILKLLDATPFEPFAIITSGGSRYEIPTADHADVNPSKTRIVIWFDDESSVTIAGIHISSIEKPALSQ